MVKRATRNTKQTNYERMAEEARLMYEDRLAGMSMRAIAAKHGRALRTVQNRLNSYVPKMLEGPATLYRNAEVEKLDELEEKLWDIIHQDHQLVSHGKVMYAVDEHTGEEVPLKDYGPVMQAMNQLKWIADRRAKLLGLDQPVRTEVTVTSGEPEDAELAAMIQRARDKAKAMEEVLSSTVAIEQGKEVIDAEVVSDDTHQHAVRSEGPGERDPGRLRSDAAAPERRPGDL